MVFDLDGTLVDTAPDLHAHLNEMLAELGRPGFALADVRPMIGDGARMLLAARPRRLRRHAGGRRPRSAVRASSCGATPPGRCASARPSTASRTRLQALAAAGIKLGVCTNKPQAPTDRLLAELDLARHFPVVIGGDSLAVRKPDPGHLRAVLDRLGAAPGRAVLVGDSANDVLDRARDRRALRAGELRLHADRRRASSAPTRVIDHMSELPAALAGLRWP